MASSSRILNDEMSALAERHKRGEVAIRKVKPLADKAAETETDYAKAKTDFDTAQSDAETAALALQMTEKVIADLPALEKAQSAFEALKQKWQEASDELNKLTALDGDYKVIVENQTALDVAKACCAN
ncbi:MAG: hypothetical protein VB111_11680 [Clostridiaceae bacterium]|nr:hypothetical protein [Clostridiaceae bacterium]